MLIRMRQLKKMGCEVDFDQKRGELKIQAPSWSHETQEHFQNFVDSVHYRPPELEDLICKIDELAVMSAIREAQL